MIQKEQYPLAPSQAQDPIVMPEMPRGNVDMDVPDLQSGVKPNQFGEMLKARRGML